MFLRLSALQHVFIFYITSDAGYVSNLFTILALLNWHSLGSQNGGYLLPALGLESGHIYAYNLSSFRKYKPVSYAPFRLASSDRVLCKWTKKKENEL